jgi:hypothetical protein
LLDSAIERPDTCPCLKTYTGIRLLLVCVAARISRPIATEHSGWDYDNEGLWQFGTFGSANIRAWTMRPKPAADSDCAIETAFQREG